MAESGRPDEAVSPRVTETAAIYAAHQDVVKLLYMNRWSCVLSEADKSSATLLSRSGLNAARIARDMALTWPQWVIETLEPRIYAGVLQFSVSRGRVFSFFATTSSWAWLTSERSIPFG